MQDNGGREEGEDQDQLLISLLIRLGLARKEASELGQMIQIVNDPLVLFICMSI